MLGWEYVSRGFVTGYGLFRGLEITGKFYYELDDSPHLRNAKYKRAQ